MVWLAQHPHPREPKKVRDIAVGTYAAPGYLVKVLQGLAKAGILSAQRGIHGGFTLVRDPAGLSVLEVINAVDPVERIRRCPLALETHQNCLCPMHKRLDDALAAIEAGFRESTIEDMLGDPDRPPPLCNVGEGSQASSPASQQLDSQVPRC